VDTAILPEVPPGDHRRLPASITASARTPKAVASRARVLSWLALGKSGPESHHSRHQRLHRSVHIRSIVRKLTASNIPHAVAQGVSGRNSSGCNPADEDIANR